MARVEDDLETRLLGEDQAVDYGSTEDLLQGAPVLLESGFGDVSVESLGKDQVRLKLSANALAVEDKFCRRVATILTKDITCFFLRKKGSRSSSKSWFVDESFDDEDDLELVIVYYPVVLDTEVNCCCLCCPCCCYGRDFSRVREQLVLHSAESPDFVLSWEQAISSAVAGTGAYDVNPSRVRRMLVIISPKSGKGRAIEIFEKQVRPILESSRITSTVVVTRLQNDATRIVLSTSFSSYDGLVVVGGDGMIYEVVQGLKAHQEYAGTTLPASIGVIPCGSGNGMSASLHWLSEDFEAHHIDPVVNAAVAIARGRTREVDLWKVSSLNKDGEENPVKFGCLSLTWALVADIDIESERYRCLGGSRFLLGAAVRLCCLRRYRAQVSYLPAERNDPLPGVKQEAPDWVQVDSDDGFAVVWAMNVSHATNEHHVSPQTLPNNGVIDLIFIKGDTSRASLVSALLALENAEHVSMSFVHRVPVRAFRIDPLPPSHVVSGTLALDGELLEPLSRIQVEMLPSEAHFFGL